MEPKNSKIFKKETMQAVSAFCESEGIKDTDHFMYLCFKQGFDIKRYGLLGNTLNEGEKHLKTSEEPEKWVEKEVIVEKRVEIPVEVIKEVEKIVEVPVEIIKEVVIEKEVVKEIPVEKVVTKIEYISDKTTENELGGIISELEEKIFYLSSELESERKIFSTKIEEMEIIFQKEMSKKNEELNEARQTLDIPKENEKTKLLEETLFKLRKELSEKIKIIDELEKQKNNTTINMEPKGAVFLKGSNLTQKI
jgi:hypothetical protein